MADFERYTIIGTSVGALAVATELRLANRSVTVASRPEEIASLDRLAGERSLRVVNEASNWGPGAGDLSVSGIVFEPDLRSAVSQADIVVVMVPPNFHEALLAPCADILRDDQLVLLSPGGIGGALLISRLAARSAPKLLVGQTSSMPHAAHPLDDGGIRVTGKKKTLSVGVFPAARTQELLDRLSGEFPQFTGSANVIENGLSSAALGVHPVPMIMNAAQIEQKGSYHYDGYDITPSIARVIEAVDAERQDILRVLGGKVQSFADWLVEAYDVDGSTFYEVVHNVGSYKQALSPPDLCYRYLSEDVPTQAVPAALLGRALGVPTPTLDALVVITNAIHGIDYWTSGWSLERLGLAGLNREEILSFVQNGQSLNDTADAVPNGVAE